MLQANFERNFEDRRRFELILPRGWDLRFGKNQCNQRQGSWRFIDGDRRIDRFHLGCNIDEVRVVRLRQVSAVLGQGGKDRN